MASTEPDGIRLVWRDLDRVFDLAALPIVLRRSVQATYCITDARVSRSHARIDWQGNSFSLTDLSYNGTYVRFGPSGELLSLKRGSCTFASAPVPSAWVARRGRPIAHRALRDPALRRHRAPGAAPRRPQDAFLEPHAFSS